MNTSGTKGAVWEAAAPLHWKILEDLPIRQTLPSFESLRHFFDASVLEWNSDVLKLILSRPELVGCPPDKTRPMNPSQRVETILGEYFAALSRAAGESASAMLMRAQWRHATPEWFDHRHHFLSPQEHLKDHFIVSASEVLRHVPRNGRVLDLCSGDGFFAYWMLRPRARQVDCIEILDEAMAHACRHHAHSSIHYQKGSVLDVDYGTGAYDVVVIRGAIEHFNEVGQQKIFAKSLAALRPGGWFVGDTPANPHATSQRGEGILPSHEYEWKDEAEMRRELSRAFRRVETWTFESADRSTLYWACQKEDALP